MNTGTFGIAENLLSRDEGKRNKMYIDTKGVRTIGIGHNLESSPISDEAIDIIFKDDISSTVSFLDTYEWFQSVNEYRQAVLIDMTFNVGRHGIMRFRKMISGIESRNYPLAASEILDSSAARELPVRYRRLANMMRTGELMT